ncbi:MAG: D-2-hydroxyacid dehydrogenase [Lachnospiraceae bacterium]|nr:D-2-hydroxyacid dehydrogenase [Lachnospiraceae bacterium]
MKIVIMEANTLGDDVDLSIYESIGEIVSYPESNPLENAKRIEDADIIVVNKIPMNEETLKYAKNLKLICITATGTNIVDFPYVNERGITVTNVKGYSTMSVVQHTFALLFYVYEKLSYYDQFVKSGAYAKSDVFTNFDMKFHELMGKTWGIIGLGEIGRKVADVAKLFGCRVIYYSTSGKNSNADYDRVELDELLQTSDIISIHAPLNDKTKNLIDEAEFKKMKKDAVLLNLGRGPIVNEAALANALLKDEIGGAGLDVLTVEPMTENNPLLQVQDSNKLIITPHIAWATVEARKRCAQEVFENMKAFVNGEERNVVRE